MHCLRTSFCPVKGGRQFLRATWYLTNGQRATLGRGRMRRVSASRLFSWRTAKSCFRGVSTRRPRRKRSNAQAFHREMPKTHWRASNVGGAASRVSTVSKGGGCASPRRARISTVLTLHLGPCFDRTCTLDTRSGFRPLGGPGGAGDGGRSQCDPCRHDRGGFCAYTHVWA